VTITAYGQPIAELVPAGAAGRAEAEDRRRQQALRELEEHWASLQPAIVGAWTRDELYGRD
jgi:antitoxin (DNA-binding transcriptional repressor) of toxin-antitoxin stability system